MALTPGGKTRRRPVHHCPSCGKRLPTLWQGRKAVTAVIAVLLLVAGFVAARLIVPRDVQLVEEQSRMQLEQARLRRWQQQLEVTQQQLAAESQRLAEERKQLAAAKPPEQSRVVGGESAAPKAEPQPRQEPQVAVGIPPPPPVQPPTEKTWRNSIGIDFVLIAAGEFLMGSESGDSDEKPVHRVRISKNFYLGKYEVTQAQWHAVMGDNPSRFKGDTLPVEQVSWEDAQKFIERLNAQEGGTKYRLPTEVEWEYAARAGTTTAYSFGDNPRPLGEYAWFSENFGNTTHPVGQKQPNPWGLYDMHGNVWEWVQDWYGPYTCLL
jgi:formylglycine-generating enzyme required for sulfatase activity